MHTILVSFLMIWVCRGQGKVKMTRGLTVFSQANSSISQCSQDSEEFWKVPPWASEGGRAKWVLGALVLNSSLLCLWSGFLIC